MTNAKKLEELKAYLIEEGGAMFEHRQKAIGKSKYTIVKVNGGYAVKEIYNGSKFAESKYTHRNINDALSELEKIRCEQNYTDSSRTTNY